MIHYGCSVSQKNNYMTHTRTAIILFLVVLVGFIFLNAPTAIAQGTGGSGGFVPLSDANFSNLFGTPPSPSESGSLAKFLNSAFKAALSVGAILAVLRIAWAGFQYMTTDAIGSKQKAREILGDVVLGILLLLSIYLILYQ